MVTDILFSPHPPRKRGPHPPRKRGPTPPKITKKDGPPTPQAGPTPPKALQSSRAPTHYTAHHMSYHILFITLATEGGESWTIRQRENPCKKAFPPGQVYQNSKGVPNMFAKIGTPHANDVQAGHTHTVSSHIRRQTVVFLGECANSCFPFRTACNCFVKQIVKEIAKRSVLFHFFFSDFSGKKGGGGGDEKSFQKKNCFYF